MTNRVYNFGAGPAMIPTKVMMKIQQGISGLSWVWGFYC
ncbi:MAG: hypothetical protein CM1200mP28_03130 [Deltaproteobacteria bacterium]|nr:MAG: hypothetical protein CM1200mP28_03130 [Deltaproteobacteria bacterium]